jgi:hypothetical protein
MFHNVEWANASSLNAFKDVERNPVKEQNGFPGEIL